MVAAALVACGRQPLPPASPGNGGLSLPDGFEAAVLHDGLGRARHLAVTDDGTVYVKLRVPNPKGLVALRDTGGDGFADEVEVFGNYDDTGEYGTGMRIRDGYIYFSTAREVYRQKITPRRLVPDSPVELILKHIRKGDRKLYEHIAKALAFDDQGHMYVGFGAPGDSCQEQNRRPGAPGQDPCPELEWQGGIWQFDANRPGQTQEDGRRYATGIRSVVAMTWNRQVGQLYALQHGRDDLYRSWSQFYSRWQSAVLPSEEFFKVPEGFDGGWPYYYYDWMQSKKLLNPEYGGDGVKVGKGGDLEKPLVGFPGHFAPNDVLFYEGDQFPERYRHGAFIAFHGSTIRMPYSQAGYIVALFLFGRRAIRPMGSVCRRLLRSGSHRQHQRRCRAAGWTGARARRLALRQRQRQGQDLARDVQGRSGIVRRRPACRYGGTQAAAGARTPAGRGERRPRARGDGSWRQDLRGTAPSATSATEKGTSADFHHWSNGWAMATNRGSSRSY